MTNAKGEAFLRNNNVNVKIDPSFHGISYCFKKTGNEKNLDPLMTMGRLVIDTPKYFLDIWKVVRNVLEDGYDIIVNDASLQTTRIPAVNLMNILHYTLPQNMNDLKRACGGLQPLFYEGLIEPVINASSILTHRFCMDLRRSHIDYEHTYPPIVSRTKKNRSQVRSELNLRAKDKLIVDGRSNPPIALYETLANEYAGLNFLVRSSRTNSEHVKSMSFIPNMVDYVAAADLFITSAGFSSLSEGAVSGIRMLIDHPGLHFEGLKNLVIAEGEGYGKRISCLVDDILCEINERRPVRILENGLPYAIEMLNRLSQQKPLLQALIGN